LAKTALIGYVFACNEMPKMDRWHLLALWRVGGRQKGDVVKPVALILTSTFCVSVMLVCGCGKETAQNAVPPPSISSPAPAVETAGEAVEDTVLVTVNGKTLTRSMLADLTREIAARQGVPPQMLDAFIAQMEQPIIEQFVKKTLLESEAERLAITVSKEDIDAVVDKLSEGLPEGTTIDQALAVQGMDMDRLREEIEANERIRKLCEPQVEQAESVTTAQIETFYSENSNMFQTQETVDASHILVACDQNADEEAHAAAKEKIEAIRKQLEEGADFAELAKEKSACPSKKDGGSLGSVTRGQMVPPFEEAAFSQEVGKVGPAVKTQFGYHVILVTGKTAAGVRPLEEVSEGIRQRLAMERREKVLAEYVDTLREQATITYPNEAPESDL
jgi:peptidyl-prolyl cis-trans isomerase C